MIFSIVDVETTGLYNKDRIVEIGIVQMDDSGNTLGEFESLINPMRDIANSSIHGIEARHVADAPTFAEVAATVLEFLQGADILVAHNFPFDWRMLSHEFERLGYNLPKGVNSLCTMKAFQMLDPGCPRRLAALCSMYEIPIEHHSALSDARATAELLKIALGALEFGQPSEVSWQPHAMTLSTKCKPRGSDGAGTPRYAVLERLVSALPSHQGEGALDTYLELLDRVFADSILEESEAHELVDLANSLGLSAPQVQRAHEMYFGELVAVAVRDGYVSELEREHLNAVSHALGLDVAPDLRQLEALRLYPRDLSGKTVCFTGEMRGKVDGQLVDRKALEQLAAGFGLQVKGNVNKKLDLLVVKDPYTMSGKAKKAREYRVPIVSEQVFWNWAGVQAT